jgi:adenylate cyclase class IV
VIELELKAVVHDVAALLSSVRAAGAREDFTGRMIDHRLDYATGALTLRDEVVRVREYRDSSGRSSATLDWKGPATVVDGYKRREEVAVTAGDARILLEIMGRIGLLVTRTVERDIQQFALAGAMVRLEHYRRMDDLVEVEGEPEAIERVIAQTGIPRSSFTSESLSAFVERYVARTGASAITGPTDELMVHPG